MRFIARLVPMLALCLLATGTSDLYTYQLTTLLTICTGNIPVLTATSGLVVTACSDSSTVYILIFDSDLVLRKYYTTSISTAGLDVEDIKEDSYSTPESYVIYGGGTNQGFIIKMTKYGEVAWSHFPYKSLTSSTTDVGVVALGVGPGGYIVGTTTASLTILAFVDRSTGSITNEVTTGTVRYRDFLYLSASSLFFYVGIQTSGSKLSCGLVAEDLTQSASFPTVTTYTISSTTARGFLALASDGVYAIVGGELFELSTAATSVLASDTTASYTAVAVYSSSELAAIRGTLAGFVSKSSTTLTLCYPQDQWLMVLCHQARYSHEHVHIVPGKQTELPERRLLAVQSGLFPAHMQQVLRQHWGHVLVLCMRFLLRGNGHHLYLPNWL